MLLQPTQNSPNFQIRSSNYSTGYNGFGLTASATAGTKGAWTNVTAATYTPNDVYGIFVMVSNAYTGAASRQVLLDIGVDPAGGTSYTPIISNITVGGATEGYISGYRYYFPYFIKGGSQLGLRIASNVASFTARCMLHLLEKPTNPVNMWAGCYSETIGFTSGAAGTSFTPGNASKGSWTSLGTTSRNLKYWQVGAHCNSATVTAGGMYVDLAYGDGTNFVPIVSNWLISTATSPAFNAVGLPSEMCFCDVPAGSTIYVRGAFSTTPNSGWTATAIGIGG